MNHRSKIISEINVTPFIDIMLVLLAIFMITSPMMVPGIQVDLPHTSAAPITGEDDVIVITIGNQGDIYLQDKLTSSINLIKHITDLSNNDKNKRIFIRGDQKVSYGQIVKVISTVHTAGFTKVALITDHEKT